MSPDRKANPKARGLGSENIKDLANRFKWPWAINQKTAPLGLSQKFSKAGLAFSKNRDLGEQAISLAALTVWLKVCLKYYHNFGNYPNGSTPWDALRENARKGFREWTLARRVNQNLTVYLDELSGRDISPGFWVGRKPFGRRLEPPGSGRQKVLDEKTRG
jgi:hypothetical protein